MSRDQARSYLFITCFSGEDRQFDGIRKALEIISHKWSLRETLRDAGAGVFTDAVSLINWDSRPENSKVIRKNEKPERVLISGHGLSSEAGVGDNNGRVLRPNDLRLTGGSMLYLLCCFQGKEELLDQWSEGTGLDVSNIRGCEGETETALSTIFFMHLIDNGPDALPQTFSMWYKINNMLRDFFPYIRETYKRKNYDPMKTLKKTLSYIGPLARNPDFLRFIEPVERYSPLLANLESE